MTMRGNSSMQDFDDAFVSVSFDEELSPDTTSNIDVDPLYNLWIDQASAKFAEPSVNVARFLRRAYPDHSVLLFTDAANINIFAFPDALIQPISPATLISTLSFSPSARRSTGPPGALVDKIKYGAFNVSWRDSDFILYEVRYPWGFGDTSQSFLLHEGPEERSKELLTAAGAWKTALHQEIMVFDKGFWTKNHELWIEIQKASWDDVILKQEFKDALQKDVRGFFDSEDLYKSLAIPWKRGLIMYGPPGNGKTISLKAIMKDCDAKGFAPLYVKSFQSYMGEEGSMAAVFSRARQMAPCVIILEDLDALINDRNRSFFLNQLDGLEGNDGLLVIGSTNHLDRLDPSLSTRPSRFDRRHFFDDPDQGERAQYARYWQNKLKNNKDVLFPDSLVDDIAAQTDRFSFAYLKEAFVSSLVLLAGMEDKDKPSFTTVVLEQIRSLREQINPKKLSQERDPFFSIWGRPAVGVLPVATRSSSPASFSEYCPSPLSSRDPIPSSFITLPPPIPASRSVESFESQLPRWRPSPPPRSRPIFPLNLDIVEDQILPELRQEPERTSDRWNACFAMPGGMPPSTAGQPDVHRESPALRLDDLMETLGMPFIGKAPEHPKAAPSALSVRLGRQTSTTGGHRVFESYSPGRPPMPGSIPPSSGEPGGMADEILPRVGNRERAKDVKRQWL